MPQAQEQAGAEATVRIGAGTITLPLAEVTFSTGSRGFRTNAKLDAGNGQRYQVQLNAVLIGSKPQSGKARSK